MKILLYRGKSLVSKAIQWQTRSPYSHAAVMLDDGSVIEAWHVGGVRRLHHPADGHSPGTVIDIFGISPSAVYDPVEVESYLVSKLGQKYDFRSVARFLSRRDAPANDRLFCSELLLEAFSEGGLDLLHINPAHAAPRDVGISPIIHYEGVVK